MKTTAKTTTLTGLFLVGIAFLLACGTGENQGRQRAENQVEKQDEQPTNQTDASQTDSSVAILALAEDSYNFGEISEGEKVEHEFKFTNEGNSPLIIANVQASCGCTTPDYTKLPVAPGEEGVVRVVFNSEGQLGKQHKVITVTSNANNANALLHLRGEVRK